MLSPTLEVGAFNMRCPTSAADVYPLLYQENLDTYTYFEGFFDGGPSTAESYRATLRVDDTHAWISLTQPPMEGQRVRTFELDLRSASRGGVEPQLVAALLAALDSPHQPVSLALEDVSATKREVILRFAGSEQHCMHSPEAT